MTTSAFPELSQAEQIFKDLVWEPMLKAGESWLEVELPFLSLPVIKPLGEEVVSVITDGIFRALVQVLDVTAIRWKVSADQDAYTVASLQLLIVAQESGVQSDAYQKARDVARQALSQFTQLVGA